MTPQANPFYITGGTLPGSAECYVERSADSELYEGILAGDYVFVLDSRQMGKSSLSIRALRRLQEIGTRCVFLDLTKFGVQNLNPEQWYAGMLREVGRGIGLSAQFTAYWKSNEGLSPVQRFFGALQDVALEEIPGRVAIFVDEIDITRSLPFDTDEFFAGIRQCFVGRATDERVQRLTFSLFGTATPAELIEDTRVSPFNIGHRVELEDFHYEEAAVLARHLPGDSHALLKRILYWTGGHPYLTQRICKVVAQRGPRADVDEICRALFFDGAAKESDDNLAFVRNCLLKNDLDLVSLIEMYAKVRAGKVVLDEESNPLCSLLKMSGVVRVREGRLRVRNRIYAEVFDQAWIQSQLPDSEKRRQRTAFRRGVWRATAIAGTAVLAVGGLALYAFTQARVAQKSLAKANQLAASLAVSESNLRASLSKTTGALALAEERRVAAERARREANNLAATVAAEDKKAVSAAAQAKQEAANARSASSLADSRLSRSLVSTAMLRLDAGDPAGALPPLLSALKVDRSDTRRSELHRIRLAYAIRNATSLRQVWSGTKPMLFAQFLPGEQRLLTANGDGEACVCDVTSGAIAVRFRHSGLSCVSVSRDGAWLLTGGSDSVARLWEIRTGRLIHTLKVEGTVTCVAFSDDGDHIATANLTRSGVGNVETWSSKTGLPLRHPFQEQGAVPQHLVFGPTGRRLIAVCGSYISVSLDLGDGSYSGPISSCFAAKQAEFVNDRLFLINGAGVGASQGLVQLCQANGTPVVKYKAPELQDGDGLAFRLSGDRESVLAATSSGTLQMYDLRTGAPKGPTIRSNAKILACDVSQDGQLIAAANADGTVRTWSAVSGAQVGSLLWHGGPVTHVEFDRSATRLLTCSEDGTARLWNVAPSGMSLYDLTPPTAAGKAFAFWTPQGSFVTSLPHGSYEWDPTKGVRPFMPGYRIVFSAGDSDKRCLLQAGNAIQVYDLARRKFVTRPLSTAEGYPRYASCFGFSREGNYLYDEIRPRHLRIWDLDHGGRGVAEISLPYSIFQLQYNDDSDPRERNNAVFLYPKLDRVWTLGRNGQMDVWEVHTGRHVARLKSSGPISSATLSKNGAEIAAYTAKDPQTGTWQVFRASDGAAVSPEVRYGSSVFITWFNDDGTRFVVGTPRGEAQIWDTANWRQISSLRPARALINGENTVVLGPDSTSFYSDATRRIHRVADGKAISPPLGDNSNARCVFSVDGRHVALATATSVYAYNLRTSHGIGPIVLGSPSSVRFTPDSQLLFTTTSGQLRLWDPETGEEVLPPTRCDSSGGPAFSPDGTQLEYLIGNRPVMATLPTASGSFDQLSSETLVASQETLMSMDSNRWRRIHVTGSIATAPTQAPTDPGAETVESYSIDDVMRDAGFHGGDVRGLISAAQACARADRWAAALETINQAIAAGASGSGVYFLKGVAGIHERRFAEAKAALVRATKEGPNRTLAFYLFQAAVGAGDYSQAANAFQGPIPNVTPTQGAIDDSFALLALAASGQLATARDRAQNLVDRGQKGELDADLMVVPYLLECHAILNAGPELGHEWEEELIHASGKTPVADAVLALEYARAGKDALAARQIAKGGPSSLGGFRSLAAALLRAQDKDPTSYRASLMTCVANCDRTMREATLLDRESAFQHIAAVLIRDEAEKRLRSLSPRD